MFKYELPPFFVTDLFILESFDPESSKRYGSMDVQYVY